jgi:hypothetical protein
MTITFVRRGGSMARDGPEVAMFSAKAPDMQRVG